MPSPVTLRRWQHEDAPRLAQLLGNPHVHRFLTLAFPRPYGLPQAADFINFCQQEDAMESAVLFHGEVAGGIGASLTEGEAVIGYWLGEPYWRQGIMKQALPLFLQYLAAEFPDLRRITALVYDFNEASQALLRCCGFRATGHVTLLPACDGLEHPAFTFLYAGNGAEEQPMG